MGQAGRPESAVLLNPRGRGLVARVLDCVRLIPAGRVLTYGDVAEYVGTRAARNVGRILATYDPDEADGPEEAGPVPWHRLVRADGSCAEHIRVEQLQRLRSEGVPVTGDRVELNRCRWDGRERPARPPADGH